MKTMAPRPVDTMLQLLKAKGWSQKQLALEIGATPADVSNWKQRGHLPTDRHAAVARALGVTVDALISGDISDAPPTPAAPPPLVARGADATYAVPAPVPLHPNGRPSVCDLVVQLGRTLEGHDEAARRAVASLLQDLAMHPDNAAVTGRRIAALLDVPGNGEPARSSRSGG